MSGRLSGQRVLLTQPNSFMGPAIREVFGEEGAEVISEERDLTAPGACEDLVAAAGRVDVLVANLAAVNPKTRVGETSDEDWARMFQVMVDPLHRMTRSVMPQMLERRRGKVVVIGSASALRGMPNWSAYSAARGAQLAFVRAVGIEVAPDNVQVNAIAQSFVENPSYFPPEYQRTEQFSRRLEELPIGRLATAREDALLALFLASEESNFLVGQVVPFAGGWVT